tara:strand:- start:1296 stop:1724 length:429 start_codon:yes stop_codon:yes gene_type:complete
MSNDDLKSKIIEVMNRSRLSSLATIKDNKPWARYMMIQHSDDLTCYVAAFLKSRKIEQIKNNSNVHLIMGGSPHNHQLPYINIQATATISEDLEIKEKYWYDDLKAYFSGPQDSNYVVIIMKPEFIEYMEPAKLEPEVYPVN